MSLAAKEKGNAAFKAGDYPTAIGHYSAAIHADRTDATFPLNRAAAYLKLGKNEDAERDCSTVLTLSKGNVKALFRRAQARVAMGKLSEAQKDLNEAAKLEPANQSVKQELIKVAELIKQATKKTETVPVEVSPPPKRRRIPITIVEADGRRTTPIASASSVPKTKTTPTPAVVTKTSSDANGLMNPVSSRQLSAGASSTAPAPTPAQTLDSESKPKPSSFKDAKSARDSSKPSRVGGGIFRASGEHTIFAPRERRAPPTTQEAPAAQQEPKAEQPIPTRQQEVPPPPAPAPAPTLPPPASVLAQPTPRSAPAPGPLLKSPMTLFDFTRAWESAPAPDERFSLLSRIPPDALPALFQTSLEPALFAEVVDVLGAQADAVTAAAYMHAFPRVARFGTVVRFLSAAEKARVRAVWSTLGVDARGAGLGDVWGAVYR